MLAAPIQKQPSINVVTLGIDRGNQNGRLLRSDLYETEKAK
jgi:hypothetical protein